VSEGWECPLPTCDNVSAIPWRCDECGKLFEGKETAVSRDTSVGN